MNDSTTAPKRLRLTERTVITEAHAGQRGHETFFHDALAEDMGVELSLGTATDSELGTWARVYAHLGGADRIRADVLKASGNVCISIERGHVTAKIFLKPDDVPALLAALAALGGEA